MKRLFTIQFIFLFFSCHSQEKNAISGGGESKQNKIFFEGNSILNFDGSASKIENNFYISRKVTTLLIADGINCVVTDRSISGLKDQDIIISFPVTTAPDIKYRNNNIVVYWELYNDLKFDDAATVISRATTLIALIKATGAKLIVCDMIATNAVGLRAGFQDDRVTVNTWVSENSVALGYTYCPLSTLTHLANQADADNTTYYIDKSHPTVTGNDIIATAIYNEIISIY